MTTPLEPDDADPADEPIPEPAAPPAAEVVWPPLENTNESLARLASEAMTAGVEPMPITLGFIDQLADDDPARDALLAKIKANDERYAPLIEAARIVSQQAEERYAAIEAKMLPKFSLPEPTDLGEMVIHPPRDLQLEVTGEVRDGIQDLAGVVATMADAVVPMLEVARDAREGVISLVAVSDATRTETQLLREALIEGQKSADKAAKWLLRATWALVFLTVVLVVLTIVLLTREGG